MIKDFKSEFLIIAFRLYMAIVSVKKFVKSSQTEVSFSKFFKQGHVNTNQFGLYNSRVRQKFVI